MPRSAVPAAFGLTSILLGDFNVGCVVTLASHLLAHKILRCVSLLHSQAGKAMGDKRAVTAERAFYRPFQKVVVAASGVEQ